MLKKSEKNDTLKICTCHLSFATFGLHLEQIPGSSIKLLHLDDRKFPEAIEIKIMNNDEMMKSREMKNSRSASHHWFAPEDNKEQSTGRHKAKRE